MQKSGTHQSAKSTRRKVRVSTTLNRKYVKRPVKKVDTMVSVKRSPKIGRFQNTNIESGSVAVIRRQQNQTKQINEKVVIHPMQENVNAKMRARATMVQAAIAQPKKQSAKELKEQAIKRALASANKMTMGEQIAEQGQEIKTSKIRFGFGRVLLALSCAAAAVFGIAYFVNLNMPDISLRVAAMQTGIDATYPSYIPRDYNVSSITSENNKVSLTFTKVSTDDKFILTEEKSAWDSNALLANFVKEAYGENYSIIREQGITIYINDSSATWVNGGIVYKLEANKGLLTEKQIRSIAVSL